MLATGSFAVARDSGKIGFNRDVLPIFAENCFTCHGFDECRRKADLRLDRREVAVAERDGLRAIVPEKPGDSELWARISSTDADEITPPLKTGKQLTAVGRETSRKWIEQGARYEQHWACVAPEVVESPVVHGSTSAIDRFVRARLREECVSPSPEAERATLLRRASLDLTGLPPTPLEVDAFLQDTRPRCL